MIRQPAFDGKSLYIAVVSSFCALLLIVDVMFHEESIPSSHFNSVLTFERRANQSARRSNNLRFSEPLLTRQIFLEQGKKEALTTALSIHTEALSKEVRRMATLSVHGHLLSTTVNPADSLNIKGCMNIPSLSLQEMTAVGSVLLSLRNYESEASQICQGAEVQYDSLGDACKQSSEGLFLMLYNQGLVSMALGASREEAFETLQHCRALAWTLRQCEPALNPDGQVSLPTTYALLYRVSSILLLGRLKTSGRLPLVRLTAGAAAALKALPEFLELGKRAAATPLTSSLSHEACMPNSNAVPSALSVVSESRQPATARNSGMTCEPADDGAEYFLYEWSEEGGAIGLSQNCCAVECEILMKTTRGVAGIDACCRACNKAGCGSDSDKESLSVARMSTITRPGSETMDTEIMSIVV